MIIVKNLSLPDCCAVCKLTDSDDSGIYCNALEVFMRFDELPKGRLPDCPIFDENVKTIQSIVINDRYGNVAEYAKTTRCKDCVYFTPEKSGEHWNICRFYDAPKTADGYCNDAEPKEEKR